MKISLTLSGADQLKNLAAKIKQYPAQAALAGVAAANDVSETVITSASNNIASRYNLPASYVRERFKLYRAINGQPAIVGARKRSTRLDRFAAQQLTTAAPRAKGDPRRGIAPGRKQAGVSVHVNRTKGRKSMPGSFFIPLRAGKTDGAGGMGVFWRYGDDIELMYGPSIHGSYSFWIQEKHPNISAQLAKAFTARLTEQLRRGGK